MEPEEEAQYEQDASAGLSPRKVLKRACAELVPESALPAALSRQDTLAHFEAAVSAPDGPQYVSAPIEPGMDRTLSTSSTTATAALSCGGAAATPVDTFGQMEDASRAAAERGRGGGHGGSALRPRAAAADGGGGAGDRSPPLAHSDTLRLPAVAAALSAVDDADGPAAVGAKPIAPDTRSSCRASTTIRRRGGRWCGGGGGAEGRRAAGQDCARLLASFSLKCVPWWSRGPVEVCEGA